MSKRVTLSIGLARRLAAAFIVAVGLGAIIASGGGGDPSPISPSTAVPEGIWKDATQPIEPRYVLVEPDGQLWGFPAVNYLSTVPSVSVAFEAVKGQVGVTGANVAGSYNNIVARDCAPTYACNFSGIWTGSGLTLTGTKNASGATLPNINFAGAAQGTYVAQASIAQVVGTWTMKVAMPSNFGAQGQLFVNTSGVVTVPNIAGCGFTAQLVPIAGKGYFRIAASTVGGSCAVGAAAPQMNGVAFQVTETDKPTVLHLMWHNADQSQYFWSAGTR